MAGNSGVGAFADYLPLELGAGTRHLHHHAASGAGRVDRFGERAKIAAGGVDPFEDSEQILERARQAVEKLPDDECATGAELIEQPMQLGADFPLAQSPKMSTPPATSISSEI
jgi:hypothetical protein